MALEALVRETIMRNIVNGKQFEIPDTWLDTAGMLEFTPYAKTFSVVPPQNGGLVVVPISGIAPPERAPGVKFFDKERMIKILRAFHDGTPLPPVEVNDTSTFPYRYKVYDGYHRYYASAAVGFSDLHVIVNPLEAFFAAEQRGC
jgi:hypothetical protein